MLENYKNKIVPTLGFVGSSGGFGVFECRPLIQGFPCVKGLLHGSYRRGGYDGLLFMGLV